MKVQSSIQGDSVRVSGKKRDDLQNQKEIIKKCPDIKIYFKL